MPIDGDTDFKYFLSGGSGNTNVNLSFAGDASTTEVVTNTLHNLFDKVTGVQSRDGYTDYRKIWFKNNHGSLTAQTAKAAIMNNSVETNVHFQIGVGSVKTTGTGGVNPADEVSAPGGITFDDADGEANGLGVGGDGNIDASEWLDIYIKRTITAGQTAKDNDTASLKVFADSAE